MLFFFVLCNLAFSSADGGREGGLTPTGGLLSCFAGPGENKSIDQHFFDARLTVSPPQLVFA